MLDVARETTMTTAKLFVVVFGAMIFSNFVNRAGLPDALLNIAQGFDFPPLGVIFMILLIYLVLGCVFESLSMILLTVPIFAPLVEGLGFDLISVATTTRMPNQIRSNPNPSTNGAKIDTVSRIIDSDSKTQPKIR